MHAIGLVLHPQRDSAEAVAAVLKWAAGNGVEVLGIGDEIQRLNCAACHKLGDIPSVKPLRALEGADLTRGCLSAAPGKAPRFNLSTGQSRAIRSALAKKAGPLSDKADIDPSVAWVLGRPGLFLNTVSDIDILPLVLDAAARASQRPSDEEMQALLDRRQVVPLFV